VQRRRHRRTGVLPILHRFTVAQSRPNLCDSPNDEAFRRDGLNAHGSCAEGKDRVLEPERIRPSCDTGGVVEIRSRRRDSSGEPGPLGSRQPPAGTRRGEEFTDRPAASPVEGGRLAHARGGGGRFPGWFLGRSGATAAPRDWPSRRAQTCTRWKAACLGRPGPGPGSAPRRPPRRSPGAAPQACCPVGGRLASCLIHPRPRPFTDVHPDRVCAVRERWRRPVNAGQHCWKACWGQPLRSSNLLSSATLTCDDALGSCWLLRYIAQCLSHFLSQFESWPYALFRTNRCNGTLR
jgi:hypothetical protein